MSVTSEEMFSASGKEQQLLYPCSPIQHRFWVLDQLEPGDPALNVAVRWRIKGDLKQSTIEKAFELIVKRHEVLRTYFAIREDHPTQIVEPEVRLNISSIDFTNYSLEEAEAEAEKYAAVEARRPFQLAVAPLIRVSCLRLSEDESLILVTAHHIICDGWSIGLIAAEMGEICDALQTNRQPQLPELEISYGDYSAWILEWLDSDELAEDREYWETQLKGANYFELPTDKPRPLRWANESIIDSTLLPRELTSRLDNLAKANGCTLYMLVLTVFYSLLHRYSGESDISVGTQVAGRGEVETENLVGVFINTLVMRSEVSASQIFSDLLLRVRDIVSDAFERDYMPIEKLIEILKPKRDTSRNPLFSVNFIFQRSFIENKQYSRFKLIDMPSKSAGALYDLNFFMVERPDGWRLSCEYNTALFEAASAERFLRHFRHLLSAVADNPNRAIIDLPLLYDEEQQQLINAVNQSQTNYPNDKSLPQLILEQVANHPNEIAVVCGKEQLSYQELHSLSDALAQKLLASEWAPRKRIGVYLDRSVELLIALLGVIKAGSAYVPLDPRYPRERIEYIARDAELSVILTSEVLDQQLAEIDVDKWLVDKSELAQVDPKLEITTPDSSDTAYVIYTSGSTGKPKGVPIHHQALVNFLCSMEHEPGMTSKDVLLAVTTVSFDIAGLELFLPLICGGKIIMAREADVVDGIHLQELIEAHSVTIMQATPVTWRLMLDADWEPQPGFKILCGGEAMPTRLAQELTQTPAELWNMYGPTETTIWSAVNRVISGEPISLGKPIANTQFYIVDSHAQLVPQGASGELCIGGDSVALGYFERPDLTRERFIPDHISKREDALLYKTGDRVRWRSDGTLEFLGRIDHQIKLRGYRIELGEIEAVLSSCPRIKEAVAILSGEHEDAAIRGYVVVKDEDDGEEIQDTLHDLLKDRLPAYMHPSLIIELDELPRTPNGKIDRNSLPEPSAKVAETAHEPMDEEQEYLASLWQEILDVPHALGLDSNFFELGGHSISAARLLARIEAETGRAITLAQFFHSPTLRGMAELTRPKGLYEDDFRQIVRLQSHGTHAPLIALHNTGTYFSVAKALGHDYPFVSLQLFDPDYPPEKLPETLEEVAAGYVKLIHKAQAKGPYFIMGWCLIGALAFETARQLKQQGETVHLVILDGWAPGYVRRMSRPKALIKESYYKGMVLLGESMRILRGHFSLRDWLKKRLEIRRNKARQRAMKTPELHNAIAIGDRPEAMERYGQWLFSYLETLVNKYEIKHYPGDVLVLRSKTEPKSVWFDWDMNWGEFSDSTEVDVVSGDHWTMLRDKGAEEIAEHLSRLLKQHQA